MSSVAGGVATSPPQQHQLPPPKQIRFVNNEGQPPAKRRRINAACVPSPVLYRLSSRAAVCFLCRRMSVGQFTYSGRSFANGTFNQIDAGRVENVKQGAMGKGRCVRRVRKMDMSVWDTQM